jgi:hypothetical protein
MAKAEITVNLADYAEVKEALAQAARWKEALEFYADPKHWESVLIRQVSDDEPNGGAQEWESGAAVDGGLRARRALQQFDGNDHV